MMNIKQYHLDNGIVAIEPEHVSAGDGFDAIIKQNKSTIMTILKQQGVVLLRNFAIKNAQNFNKAIIESLNFENIETVNKFYKLHNFRNKMIDKSLGLNRLDNRKFAKYTTHTLGKDNEYIQGPHVEYGMINNRPRYISMYCERTSKGAADTGIYNLHKAYESLNEAEKKIYNHAWNSYGYYFKLSNRISKFIAYLFLYKKWPPFKLFSKNDAFPPIIFPKTPMVCLHPENQSPCLQPFPFYNSTDAAVYQASVETFINRHQGEFLAPDTLKVDSNWLLVDKNNKPIEWTETDKIHFFKKIFETAIIHTWQENDILIIDNVMFGHGRMENQGGQVRNMHQLLLNKVDMKNYAFDLNTKR